MAQAWVGEVIRAGGESQVLGGRALAVANRAARAIVLVLDPFDVSVSVGIETLD